MDSTDNNYGNIPKMWIAIGRFSINPGWSCRWPNQKAISQDEAVTRSSNGSGANLFGPRKRDAYPFIKNKKIPLANLFNEKIVQTADKNIIINIFLHIYKTKASS